MLQRIEVFVFPGAEGCRESGATACPFSLRRIKPLGNRATNGLGTRDPFAFAQVSQGGKLLIREIDDRAHGVIIP